MNKKQSLRLVVGVLVCLLLGQSAFARTAADVLADLKAVAAPQYDAAKAKSDPAYRTQFSQAVAAYQSRRAPLILELLQTAPDSPELAKLLPERWKTLRSAHQEKIAIAEITAYLNAHPNSSIKSASALTRVSLEIESSAKDVAVRSAAVAAFEAISPNDPHLPEVLKEAWDYSTDQKERDGLLSRLQKEFPGSNSTEFVIGETKAQAGVGKPFELSFKDVLTGKQINMKDLAGKVVVIDFWATWCGPCMAEMPTMKKLYAEYREQGVEFIGVSLDQADGGLDKLKECVATNGMTWPQYYQGKGWESEFSRSWGVSSIPRVFVVDARGNLADTRARGRLETLLPKLLKEAKDSHQVAGE